MKPIRYSKAFIVLHWSSAILLFSSALLAKQKEMPMLPLNLHTILGGILLIVMMMRLIEKLKTVRFANSHRLEMFFYLLPYLFVFFVLGMGVWIAYQRNLLGYLIDPATAVGRGSFKLLADIHQFSWQMTLGWVFLHVGMVTFRRLNRFSGVKQNVDT